MCIRDSDRIECVYYDEEEHGDKKTYFRKMYRRDRDRYEEHMARSKRLQDHNGWLVMKHKEIHGGRMRLCQDACPEIIDLLQFLGDWVYYEMDAQFQVVKNQKVKIYPPFTGDEKRWHCTRQGDWKSTTRFQRESQQHRELFHEIQCG